MTTPRIEHAPDCEKIGRAFGTCTCNALDRANDEIARLAKELEIHHAKSVCMCGDYMRGHSDTSGHGAVSMYDYALDRAQQRAEAAESTLATVREENERLRDLADSVVFHQLCCMGYCHESMLALAHLAKAVDFKADPATAEEIEAVLAAPTWEDRKTHDCYVDDHRFDFTGRDGLVHALECAHAEIDRLTDIIEASDALREMNRDGGVTLEQLRAALGTRSE